MNKINEILNYGLLAEFAYITLESDYYKQGAGIDKKTNEFGYNNTNVNNYLNSTEQQIEELLEKPDLIKQKKDRDFFDYFKTNYEDIYEYMGTSKNRVNNMLKVLNDFEVVDFISDDERTFKEQMQKDNASDFQAILLKQGKQYIIAFRGTSSVKDAFVDINIANFRKNANEQYDVAIEFIENMKTKYKFTNSDLILTGHSLGGILSQCIGANLEIKAFSYNPLGTSSLLKKLTFEKTIYEQLIKNTNTKWLDKNIFTLSYIDGGSINGDVLSNVATFLNGSRHIGCKIDFFGKNVGIGGGHSIITLNKLLEEQSEKNLTTLDDIINYNNKQKTLFFDIVKQREIDIIFTGGIDQEATIVVQTANDIFTNKNIKDMLKNITDKNIHSITINANISKIEDKNNFNNKLYYNAKKNKLKVKVKDFISASKIIEPFIPYNDKLKKHNVIVELQ